MLISPDEINKSLSNKGWEYVDKKIFKSFDIYLAIPTAQTTKTDDETTTPGSTFYSWPRKYLCG